MFKTDTDVKNYFNKIDDVDLELTRLINNFSSIKSRYKNRYDGKNKYKNACKNLELLKDYKQSINNKKSTPDLTESDINQISDIDEIESRLNSIKSKISRTKYVQEDYNSYEPYVRAKQVEQLLLTRRAELGYKPGTGRISKSQIQAIIGQINDPDIIKMLEDLI